VLVDTTETLGSTIREIVPYVQAGISHVVVDRYLHTVMSNIKLDLPLEEYEDILVHADNDTVVEIGSQTIRVFVVDLVDAE